MLSDVRYSIYTNPQKIIVIYKRLEAYGYKSCAILLESLIIWLRTVTSYDIHVTESGYGKCMLLMMAFQNPEFLQISIPKINPYRITIRAQQYRPTEKAKLTGLAGYNWIYRHLKYDVSNPIIWNEIKKYIPQMGPSIHQRKSLANYE